MNCRALTRCINVSYAGGQSVEEILASGPTRTHDQIFVLSKTLRVLNRGLLFDKRRGLITTGHSHSTGRDSEWALAH
jgi:hypothetical protein